MKDDALHSFPGEVPTFHERQAAHLRELAATATTAAIKNRLLAEAQWHEDLADAQREQTP
jgi:hypothetical protein